MRGGRVKGEKEKEVKGVGKAVESMVGTAETDMDEGCRIHGRNCRDGDG
jgi:hypothetical protein